MRIIEIEGVRHTFPADATDAEIEEVLAMRAAETPRNVGSIPNDKNRLTNEERLQMLRAQLSDPGRDQTFDAELKREIARIGKVIGAQPAPAVPAAPRPSQADVRAAEVPLSPKENQRVSEAAFEAARKGWMKATGGRLKPGQTQRQAIAEWAKIQDPAETREANETAQLVETGEYEESDSVAYAGAKTAAGIGGFALGGPAGATGAEALVRHLSLAHNLKRAVDAGMDEDEAARIWAEEMSKGVATDAAINFGLPILGQIVAKIPGVKPLAEKVGLILQSRAGKRLAGRAALAEDPAREQAVRELAARTDDFVPTPGQVKGEAGWRESMTRRGSPTVFAKQEKALIGAADDMLKGTVSPAGQMEAKNLGETITSIADQTQRAVKQRLRPAFQAADDLGVQVDVRPVRVAISKALAEDMKVAGGRLKPAERADLEKMFEDLRLNPSMSPEAVLDFISRRKEVARAHTADGKPSERFASLMTQIAGLADNAYSQTARSIGQPEVAANLLRARRQYGSMIETIYEDAVKQALKKNPEDVGRLFWQGGNVSEIEQLHKMLRMAEREGVVGAAGAQKVKQDMARGFLQEGVRDVDSAAKWLETLQKDPLKRRTWDALTKGADGQALRSAMEVLSHAAQIASHNTLSLSGGQVIPISRAAGGGMGVSYVTGAIRPGMILTGLSLTGMVRALGTMYTRGDKGGINFMVKLLRMQSSRAGASAQAMQAMLPELEKLAVKYGVPEMFVGEEDQQEGQQ